MLDKNPLYKFYLDGKIPVLRYKNEGFKNFNQNDYFRQDKEELDENCKDIIGCFCMLGGMQDNFILSGVDDCDDLWIGYVEKDTLIYSPVSRQYEKAGDLFEHAKKIYEKDLEKIDKKENIIGGKFDDFDIFFTQQIIKEEDIKSKQKINRKDLKEYWHTIEDEFFKFNSALDFYYQAVVDKQEIEFLQFIVQEKLLDLFLPQIDETSVTEESKNLFPTIKKYFQLRDYKYWKNTIVNKFAPKDLYDDSTLCKLEKIIKDDLDVYFSEGKYILNTKLFIDRKLTDIKISVVDKDLLIESKEGKIPVQKLLLNKNNVKELTLFVEYLKKLEEIDEDAFINEKINQIIPKLDKFYNENEVLLNEEGFIYYCDDFKIEYNFCLDDSIITDFSLEDKLLHEEDIILNYEDKKYILDTLNKFRNALNLESQKELIR